MAKFIEIPECEKFNEQTDYNKWRYSFLLFVDS